MLSVPLVANDALLAEQRMESELSHLGWVQALGLDGWYPLQMESVHGSSVHEICSSFGPFWVGG